MIRSAVATVLACGALSQVAGAAVLWDQSPVDTSPTSVGLVNSYSPGFNGLVAFAMNDVTVPASGWTIQSISTYFTTFNAPGTSAILNVFPKTGSLPVAANNPQASPTGSGTTVSLTSTDTVINNQGVRIYTASGLNLVLAPGDYWIGLTPVQDAGFFGPDSQWSTTSPIGTGSALRLYGPDSGWTAAGPLVGGPANLDGAMKIEGQAVPGPATGTLLALGALGLRRRRR